MVKKFIKKLEQRMDKFLGIGQDNEYLVVGYSRK